MPEKGKKPPEGAMEAALCASALGLDAQVHVNPRMSSVGPPRGDKRSLTKESLFLKANLLAG